MREDGGDLGAPASGPAESRWSRGRRSEEEEGGRPEHSLGSGPFLRLSRETTLTIRDIARRFHMGSWKSLNNRLHLATKAEREGNQ